MPRRSVSSLSRHAAPGCCPWASWWARPRSAGLDELHFVWAGGHRIEQPHYFRIEGPVTLVEFDNTEDDANHVHCVWRDPTNDFGFDVLAQHRAAQHAGESERPDD